MVTTVNNTIKSYLKVAKRVDLKSSQHKKKVFGNHVWCQILSRLIMVIILSSIQISNHYVVYLKLMQYYMLIITEFRKKSRVKDARSACTSRMC